MARASVSKPDKMVNFTTLTRQFVIKMRQNRRKNAPLKNSALSTFDRNVLASAQLTSTKIITGTALADPSAEGNVDDNLFS
jgi:hypothetical protein